MYDTVSSYTDYSKYIKWDSEASLLTFVNLSMVYFTHFRLLLSMRRFELKIGARVI